MKSWETLPSPKTFFSSPDSKIAKYTTLASGYTLAFCMVYISKDKCKKFPISHQTSLKVSCRITSFCLITLCLVIQNIISLHQTNARGFSECLNQWKFKTPSRSAEWTSKYRRSVFSRPGCPVGGVLCFGCILPLHGEVCVATMLELLILADTWIHQPNYTSNFDVICGVG